MEVLNAVSGALVDCPPFINCPKVLFAARFVQPVAVIATAIFKWRDLGEKCSLRDRCAFSAISLCALSNAVLTIALFFPVSKWIRVVSVISSVISWEFFTASFYSGGILYDGYYTSDRNLPRPQNVAWLVIGAISSILMNLSIGGLIAFNPFVLGGAAIGLILESFVKYYDVFCYSKVGKDDVLMTVGLILCEAALTLLYINPFIGISIPWFVNLLLCCLPVAGIVGHVLSFFGKIY